MTVGNSLAKLAENNTARLINPVIRERRLIFIGMPQWERPKIRAKAKIAPKVITSIHLLRLRRRASFNRRRFNSGSTVCGVLFLTMGLEILVSPIAT